MALKDNLTSIRFYTQFDPYYFSVDNRPLTDIKTNLDQLADAIDERAAIVDVSGGLVPIINKIPDTSRVAWTLTRNGDGDYTITHGTGFQYSVIGTTRDASGSFVFYVYSSSSSAISIKTVNLSNVATDVRFSCIFSKLG